MNREIIFYRAVKTMYGRPYDSIVWNTKIPLSISQAQAVEFAKEELCKWAEVDSWIDIADSFATSLEKDLAGETLLFGFDVRLVTSSSR
ncbi:MAG: hypothetical protein V7731_08265 [Amphritea sp.]